MKPWILRLFAVMAMLAIVAPWCCCLAASDPGPRAKHGCCEKSKPVPASDHKCDCGGQVRSKLAVPDVLTAPPALMLDKVPVWHWPVMAVQVDSGSVLGSRVVGPTEVPAPPGQRLHLRCHILLI